MNQNIENLYIHENDLWGFPQEFKGIKFYPLKMSDTKYINMMYSVFGYPKNYIPDAQILKLSYLKFLLYVIQRNIDPSGNDISEKIKELLKYVTRVENVQISYMMDGEESLDNLIIRLDIGGVKFDEEDFEVIRWFVLEQAGVGEKYVEQFHPELEKRLEEYYQMTVQDKVSFTDEVFIFCCLMGKSIDDIKEYTLFQFKNMFGHLMVLRDYELYKPLETSGQISFKNGGEIKHYLSSLKKSGRYDSILIEKDKYMEQSDIFKL